MGMLIFVGLHAARQSDFSGDERYVGNSESYELSSVISDEMPRR
jgi:hypothetical protein